MQKGESRAVALHRTVFHPSRTSRAALALRGFEVPAAGCKGWVLVAAVQSGEGRELRLEPRRCRRPLRRLRLTRCRVTCGFSPRTAEVGHGGGPLELRHLRQPHPPKALAGLLLLPCCVWWDQG